MKFFHSLRFLYRTTGYSVVVALALAQSLGSARADNQIKVALQTRGGWDFTNAGVHFDCDFSGARLGGCEQISQSLYKVLIVPENEPINPSPWYAFRVRSESSRSIEVELVYSRPVPHPRPWTSRNGDDWMRVGGNDFVAHSPENSSTLRLEVSPQPIWISAWELLNLPKINIWTDKMCRLPIAHEETAGRSIEGRPLRAFVLGETTNANYIFVIGRQHPPEITGTMGLMTFVETIAGSSALAHQFRQNFQTVVVPVVNPDGVEHGHWRSNMGGVDLNRDWRSFSQPETAALRDWLLHYAEQPGGHPMLFVDFHSTGTNVFYAAPETQGDACPGFTDQWLAALHQNCPAFHFERDDSHNLTEATSKAWAHAHLHVPSVTCEFGYNTERNMIRDAARTEAEEMMKLLLKQASHR